MIPLFAFVDTIGPWTWVVLAIALLASAFYSGSETGTYAVNGLRLELRASSPADRSARRLHGVLARRELLLCVLLLGNNIANELAAIAAQRVTASWVGHASMAPLFAALVLTPIVFVTGEALPKHLFRAHAETWTYRVAPLLIVSRWLLLPLTILVLPVARRVHRWASGRDRQMRALRHDEHALETLLVAGGAQLSAVRETALGIGSSGERPVTEVMVPVDEARCLAMDQPVAEFREKFREWRHSRYPVRNADGTFSSYVYFMDPLVGKSAGQNLGDFGRSLVQLDARSTMEDALQRFDSATGRVGVVLADEVILGFVFATDLVSGLLSMDNPLPPMARDSE